MKKVHISLVGGQPIPVYLGIKDDGQASEIVLVCSDKTREEVRRIKEQFPKRNINVVECSPIDIYDIEKVSANLCEQYKDVDITLNLTSGTKLWTLGFYRTFASHKNVHFIYVDQTNSITDIETKEIHKSDIEKNIRFELYGTPLTSFRNISEYTSKDFRMMRLVEKMRHSNRTEFFELTHSAIYDKFEEQEVKLESAAGSILIYDDIDNKADITFINTNTHKTYHYHLQSEHLFDILFNNGWFELKTALEVSRNGNVRDVWLNCEFDDNDGSPKNEIDIIADLGSRLLFVECKTTVFDTTDIDKFHSALRNFSGTSSAGLFVTNDMPNEKNRMRYIHAMEKCNDNNILAFNFSLWKENPLNKASLNDIINSQINTQNKR